MNLCAPIPFRSFLTMPQILHVALLALLALPAFGTEITASAAAAEPQDPLAVAEQRVQTALAELRKLEDRITAEKAPLIESITELQEIIAARREALAVASDSARDATRTIEELHQAIREEADALSRIRAVADDVLDLFESRAHPETIHRLTAALDAARAGTSGAQVALIDALLTEFQISIEPRELTANVLTPEGLLLEGIAVRIGPLGLFFDPKGTFLGFLYPDPSLRPQLTPATGIAKELRPAELRSGQSIAIPLDPSLGGADLTPDPILKRLIQHLEQGGIWIFPILALGGFSLLATVFKLIQLARQNPDPIIGPDQNPETLPMPARTVAVALAALPSDTDAETCAETVHGAVLQAQPGLERGLAILSVTASTAPLLGLLGTVTGIIQTFQVIATTAGADPRALSGGISEALVSTEVGLVVAIPALVAHAFLSRRVQGILQRLDGFAGNLSTRIRVSPPAR